MSNVSKPAIATITVFDPKMQKAIDDIKADTQAILTALEDRQKPDHANISRPAYFSRGYFG